VQSTVLQQNSQEINLKLPTVVLFVEFNTTMAFAIVTDNAILSVQVLAKAVGVKLLKVISFILA